MHDAVSAEHPGAISQVAELKDAADAIREAVALVAGVDEDDVEVDLRVERALV